MIYDSEENAYVCPKCGCVTEISELYYGKETRSTSLSEAMKKARTGSPLTPTKIAMGLTTNISAQNRDAKGMAIKGVSRAMSKKLRAWHKRTTVSSTVDRALQIANPTFRKLFNNLNLPDAFLEEATIMFREVMERGLIRGRLIETIVAAIVYILCREKGIPRTLKDISAASEISKKEIGKAYKYLVKELGLKVKIQSPHVYLDYYAQRLNVPYEVKEKAKELLSQAIEKGLLSGRSPTVMAAACLLLAAKVMDYKEVKQRELAQIAQVTEVTIKNRCQEIAKSLGLKIKE